MDETPVLDRCTVCGDLHSDEACPVADWLGQVLNGRYRLLSVLGVGGMGLIFAARHELVGRRFAIKLVHPDRSRQAESVIRFRREAIAAGSLDSEHIAAVTDFGLADNGQPYIVMEYLDGEDLARVLMRRGALPAAAAAEAVRQAARGLAVAHAQGIIHRDLKPGNLFVCRRPDGGEVVKVLDFGIAKLRSSPGLDPITRTGVAIGTPHYMSPEQARGERDADARTDTYALGLVLYELLSGHKAHAGSGYNEVLYNVMSREPTPLSEVRPELPDGLLKTVARAIAYRAEDRYQSASELIAALEPWSAPSDGRNHRLLDWAAWEASHWGGVPPPAPVLGENRPDAEAGPAVATEDAGLLWSPAAGDGGSRPRTPASGVSIVSPARRAGVRRARVLLVAFVLLSVGLAGFLLRNRLEAARHGPARPTGEAVGGFGGPTAGASQGLNAVAEPSEGKSASGPGRDGTPEPAPGAVPGSGVPPGSPDGDPRGPAGVHPAATKGGGGVPSSAQSARLPRVRPHRAPQKKAGRSSARSAKPTRPARKRPVDAPARSDPAGDPRPPASPSTPTRRSRL